MEQNWDKAEAAEYKILVKIVNNPDIIFDIDGTIREIDFGNQEYRVIYSAIKLVVVSETKLENNQKIDPLIIQLKISDIHDSYYKSNKKEIDKIIKDIYEDVCPNEKDFKEFLKIVLADSVKRQSNRIIDKIKKEKDQFDNPLQVISFIEKRIFDFTNNLFKSNDIEIVGQGLDEWLLEKQKEAKSGNVHIGIPTGFDHYDACIGGAMRNGTVHVIAARPKRGKSFLALNIGNNVSKNYPVLYLDTELENNYQSVRRLAIMSGIPLLQIEYASFFNDPSKVDKIKQTKSEMLKNKIYYQDIKGWSIDRQISVIRRFFAKIVGKNPKGKFNPALIILDYLKLMRPKDKGKDEEWEALGYRMTALHDLMWEYNNPMLLMAQQNRDGIEKDDDSTISGSDRIIWLCDSFSILSKKNEQEMALQLQNKNKSNLTLAEKRFANCKIKIVDCRHGPGTPGRKFIGFYADIHDPLLERDEVCGIFQEKNIQTIVINQ
jgi:replicative DNA helicase